MQDLTPLPDERETVTEAERADFTGPRQVASYRILRELGHGGMGTVFEAWDEKMERRVALKVLSRHQAPAKAGARFDQEAWIAGKLDHPNLVKVHERGTWEDLRFYSMELVTGGSLGDVVANMRRWGRDDRLGLAFGSRECVQWAIQQIVVAARALDYAHRQGVVHRDVKPGNLLLATEPLAVKIADFGLAIDADTTRMTSAGTLLGTLAYMAPEQILGRGQVDARTDVYALAVTLFELLTLELPYTGQTQQLYMNAVLTAQARRPSKLNERVGRDLEVVLEKALEKNPPDRYASARAFADDLENVLHLRPIEARPPTRVERVVKWARRRPLHAALVAVLAIGLPVTAILGARALEHARLSRQIEVDELWNRVRWSVREGDRERTLARVEDVLRVAPDHFDALRARALLHHRGAIELHDTDPTSALGLAEQALADVERASRLVPGAAWPHALRAILLRERLEVGLVEGEPERVRREIAAAEERAQGLRGERPSLDDLDLEAWIALEEGELERARDLYTEMIAQRANSPLAYTRRAATFEELGRLDEALVDYRTAVALSGGEVYPRFKLGRLLTHRGTPDSLREGARILEEAATLDPDLAALHEVLAHNYLEQARVASTAGETDRAGQLLRDAEREARRALELDGSLVWSHVKLGASVMEQHRLGLVRGDAPIDEAMSHYARAVELARASDDAASRAMLNTALQNRCDALLQSGDLGRALVACREAVALEPGDPINHYNLAGAYALLGRPDDALASLARDVDLGDTDWSYLTQDPWFASLRPHPAFQSLVRRMQSAR